jgi:hypothetical protein
MKLVPLTVSLNDAAPVVTDDGRSDVMEGVGFGVRTFCALAEPGSAIPASARIMMSAHDPRFRQGALAAGAIGLIS